MIDKYLLLHPSGEMEWVELHRVRRYDDIYCGDYAYDLNEIYRVLNAGSFEQVSLRIPGIVILIDEVGKVIDPPKAHNELASRLYGGYEFGDDIVGSALFFKRIGPNIYPLDRVDEARLELFLGLRLPEKN